MGLNWHAAMTGGGGGGVDESKPAPLVVIYETDPNHGAVSNTMGANAGAVGDAAAGGGDTDTDTSSLGALIEAARRQVRRGP